MANRSVKEGLVSVGNAARVRGQDRLRERAARFPHGIVSVARRMTVTDRYINCDIVERLPARVVFGYLERMY